MKPPRRIQKLIAEDDPSNPNGIRALIEKLDAPPEQRLIPPVRDAVAEHVERTSLRTAAREIGMSPSGLKKFIDGNMPYTKTIRRLRRWYLQHESDSRDQFSEEEASAALTVLVADLPPGARALTIEAVLGCVEQGYTRSFRKLPGWVAEIRRRFADGDI